MQGVSSATNGMSAYNVIPASYINAIGQYIAKSFPAATTTAPYGSPNFFGSDDFKTRSDMYSGKMDHVFTPWYTASASYVHLATQEPNGSILNVIAESNGVIHRYQRRNSGQQYNYP